MTAKISLSCLALTAAGVLLAAPATAQTRTNIQIAGSSTVLPFASIVAEEFGQFFPEFDTPVVGSGGSGGGLRQFCEGVGPNTIDIANSSRAIKSSEIDACHANGVTDIREIRIGYDGIVFASRLEGPDFALEPRHIYAALGANQPEGTALPTLWSDIDPSLPAQRIHGDCHLGQAISSRESWYFVDFEGEPLVPLEQRRRPDLAVRDVAGMLRSFSSAAASGSATWLADCRAAFLEGYGPLSTGENQVLRALEIDKACYEVRYERRYRPHLLDVPMSFLKNLATTL